MPVWQSVLKILLVFIIVYGSYCLSCRFAVTQHTVACLFYFRRGRDGDNAKLNSCSGYLVRPIRFPAQGRYTFDLSAQLTGGDLSILLLDRSRHQLLCLDPLSPTARIELDKRKQYYLRWEFQHTTGTCLLHWSCP